MWTKIQVKKTLTQLEDLGVKPLPSIDQFTVLFAKVSCPQSFLSEFHLFQVLINGFTVYDLVDRALATGLYLAPSLLVRHENFNQYFFKHQTLKSNISYLLSCPITSGEASEL